MRSTPPTAPLITVDLLIFSLQQNSLQLLLVKRPTRAGEPYPDHWALPGGFVHTDKDRTLLDCAQRTLKEKTGIKTPYLEQLGSWGSRERDPRAWSATHVYFALIDALAVQLTQEREDLQPQWHPVSPKLEKLRWAFDHAQIVKEGLQRLRSKAEYTSLPAHLLPSPFTLPELQKAYEIVLGRRVDKSGFRTRMLAADFLLEAGQRDVGAPHLAQTYRLRSQQLVFFPRTFSPRQGH